MTLSTHLKKWNEICERIKNPYDAVDEFIASAASYDWWPYVVIADQLESGWTDDLRGALAYYLAERFLPSKHGMASFIVLGGQWPLKNATAALNLLSLAHRARPSTPVIDRFVSAAVLRCLQHGLGDSSPLIAEEALNVLGGLSGHHVSNIETGDISRMRNLAAAVAAKIDDKELATWLRDRANTTLLDAKAGPAIDAGDARRALGQLNSILEPMVSAPRETSLLAALKTHVTALVWAAVDGEASNAVQAIRIEDSKEKSDNAGSAWGIVEEWLDVIRTLVGDTSIVFAPLDVGRSSLVITFRIDADPETREAIVQLLRSAQGAPLKNTTAEDFANALRLRGLRVRVAHIDSSGASTSLKLDPGSADHVPLRVRKLASGEVPQANDLEKVFRVVNLFARGEPITTESLDEVDPRQVQYYKAAARALGLVSIPGDVLSQSGWLVNVAKGDERYRRLATAFEVSPCGQAWIEWSDGAKLSDVAPRSAKEFLTARSELTGKTVGRRASTLDKWLEKLRQYA